MNMSCFAAFFASILVISSGVAMAESRVVRVFVALADNEHQSIAKVPAKIGNGDDAGANLYWGCTDGLKSVFSRSKSWKLEKTEANPTAEILERRHFRHSTQDCVLIAEAWRGRHIHSCLTAFFRCLQERKAALTAFIGHNGLMDAPVTVPLLTASTPETDAIVLCCVSRHFFKPHFGSLRVRHLLTTEQLMYPGSFLLRDAVEVWLRGGTRSEMRMAAAQAYAANQHISVKAASGVFTKPD